MKGFCFILSISIHVTFVDRFNGLQHQLGPSGHQLFIQAANIVLGEDGLFFLIDDASGVDFIVGLLTLALIGVGIYSMSTVNLGSVPDITNNQVQVITVSPNLATEDIEQFVTYPVELAMGNLPGVDEIRSISRFGLSVVTIVFEDDMGTYLPRQLVQEKLNELQETIPQKFGSPTMGPISTGLGQIYEYTIQPQEGYESQYSPMELRTIQEWIVKRQLTLLDGVVEVNSFGG